MDGSATLSTQEIQQMTAPELSVLRYAMMERDKNRHALYESMLGGMS